MPHKTQIQVQVQTNYGTDKTRTYEHAHVQMKAQKTRHKTPSLSRWSSALQWTKPLQTLNPKP